MIQLKSWYELFPFLKGHALDQMYRTLVRLAVNKHDLGRLMGLLDPRSRLLRKEFRLLEKFHSGLSQPVVRQREEDEATLEWLLVEPSRNHNLCRHYITVLENQGRDYRHKYEEMVCSDHRAYGHGEAHFKVRIFGTELVTKIWYEPELKLVGFGIIVGRNQLTEEITYGFLSLPDSQTTSGNFYKQTRIDSCFMVPEVCLPSVLLHGEDSISDAIRSYKVIVAADGFAAKMEEELRKLGVPVEEITPISYSPQPKS